LVWMIGTTCANLMGCQCTQAGKKNMFHYVIWKILDNPRGNKNLVLIFKIISKAQTIVAELKHELECMEGKGKRNLVCHLD